MQPKAIISSRQKLYMTITAIIAWVGLVLQFYFIMQSTIGYSKIKLATNFFSYFTILTNLLVAICITSVLFNPLSRVGIYFSKATVQSALALYIFIVGLVYNTILRGIVTLTGPEWITDNILHVVVPVLFVIYWFVFVPKGILKYKDGVPWIFYPLVYLVYSMIRGSIVHWYPYPFLNTDVLGYQGVLLNIVGMVAAFFVVGLLMIAVNRTMKKM
jgi:hypothetical protein